MQGLLLAFLSIRRVVPDEDAQLLQSHTKFGLETVKVQRPQEETVPVSHVDEAGPVDVFEMRVNRSDSELALVETDEDGADSEENTKEDFSYIGDGICTGGDGDFTASQLGTGFALDPGHGWKRCGRKSLVWCKNRCSSTDGCEMISHSDECCFLFRKASCTLDPMTSSVPRTNYATFKMQGIPTTEIGDGICIDGDGDFTEGEVAYGFALHTGLGWRRCAQKSLTWCKRECASTKGCEIISHGGCCFLFRKSSCSLSSKYASQYVTYALA